MAAFASVDDFEHYFGEPVAPGTPEAAELSGRLTRASGRVLTMLRELGGRVRFDEATGMPLTATPRELKHARALMEATCEQARHMETTGEAADGSPFAGGSFGPLTLNAADGGGAPGSDARYSQNAVDVLVAAGLRSTRIRG